VPVLSWAATLADREVAWPTSRPAAPTVAEIPGVDPSSPAEPGPVKTVAHYADGKILKGFIQDFYPSKPFFHLLPATTGFSSTDEVVKVRIEQLKAVFFVRDFAGNPSGSSAAATATTEEIPNVPPSAGFAFEPAGPMAGTAVNFTDTSVDADGTIHSWVWDFGDGNASTDRNPPHAYAAAGNYTVTLTVTDNRGGIDSESRVVTVAEIPTTPPPDGRIGGGLGLLALILAILAVILLAFFLLRRRRPAAATLPRPGNLP